VSSRRKKKPAAGTQAAKAAGRSSVCRRAFTWANVEQARRAGGKLVRSVEVFDVYEGDQVAADRRSLALRVVMRSPERTLSERDIAGVRAKILTALEREFEATLR